MALYQNITRTLLRRHSASQPVLTASYHQKVCSQLQGRPWENRLILQLKELNWFFLAAFYNVT